MAETFIDGLEDCEFEYMQNVGPSKRSRCLLTRRHSFGSTNSLEDAFSDTDEMELDETTVVAPESLHQTENVQLSGLDRIEGGEACEFDL